MENKVSSRTDNMQFKRDPAAHRRPFTPSKSGLKERKALWPTTGTPTSPVMATPTPRSRRDVEWADGIRGIASLCIVTSHCVRAFVPEYLSPADDVDVRPHLFQLPFFHIIAAGPFMVSIFFLLSGYVCGIKPIRLSAEGKAEEARKVIGSSAFRRVFRIGIPAIFATLFPWCLAQLGAFGIVPEVEIEGMWLERTTPRRIPGIWAPIRELIKQCFNTWAVPDNMYERNLWSLGWEMRGSMVVFLVLFVTAVCTSFWRRVILVCMTIYYYKSGEFITPFLFFAGTLLAEISLMQIAYAKERAASGILDTPEPSSSRIARLRKRWPTALFIFALFLGTAPPENSHRAAWSRFVRYIFEDFITTENCDPARVIAAWGAIFLILSIQFSPAFKRFFSYRPFVFLGSISFPLYLLHGTFIRLPLAWALFSLLPSLPFLNLLEYTKDSHGDPVIIMECNGFGCKLTATVIFIIWFTLLMMACRVWKNKVDIIGVNVSRYMEELVMGKRNVSVVPVHLYIGESLERWGGQLRGRMDLEKSANGI